MSFRIRLSRYRLSMVARLVALAILAGAGMTQPTTAMPVPGVCVYYSDDTFSEVVGARGTACCGEIINWGVTTKFKRCEQVYCLDVLCPQSQSH
jgi:hypothetical protein